MGPDRRSALDSPRPAIPERSFDPVRSRSSIPAIASERLSIGPDGCVVYRLRRRWRDGTSALVCDPLTFLERLAALVPRSRAHILTYHGELTPGAPWRDLIVPCPCAPVDAARRPLAALDDAERIPLGT